MLDQKGSQGVNKSGPLRVFLRSPLTGESLGVGRDGRARIEPFLSTQVTQSIMEAFVRIGSIPFKKNRHPY